MQSDTIRLRPLGTVAGMFDVARHPQIEARASLRGVWGSPPPHGAIVGAVVETTDGAVPEFEIAANVIFAFLEGSAHGWVDATVGGHKVRYKSPTGDGLQRFPGSADAWIGNALASIQKVHPTTKFTDRQAGDEAAHIVIYAEVKEMKLTKEGSYKITLLPRLTLAGKFDAGGTPEVVVNDDAKKIGLAPSANNVGVKVLVALVRSGNSFSLEPSRPNFMPADHSPICTVKDFDDSKVKETLEAVQKLCHNRDEVKPKDEPAKH